MMPLAPLALMVLGSAAATRAAEPRAHATITPERSRLVLGVEQEMNLTIDVRDNDGGAIFAPERALASVGRITSVTPDGPNRFRARYLAPPVRVPQVAIIVVDLIADGQHLRATARLPLHGATEVSFRTSPDAWVAMQIEERGFGPVRADGQGNVTIPIVVPPGVHDGHARATDPDGNTRDTLVDLQPAPFDQVMIVAAPRFEVGSFAEVSTFAINGRGEPMAPGTTTLRASLGMVHPLGQGDPGEERFLVEAPSRLADGPLHLVATAVDVAPEPIVVLEKRTEILVPLVAGPAQRLLLSPATNHLTIGDDASVTIAVGARDRHDNPTSCAGARVTVERQPIVLIADPSGCGRVVVPTPSKPGPAGGLDVEATMAGMRTRTFIRLSTAPAVRVAVAASAPYVVGDGRQSVELRVDAYDRRDHPAAVPNLRWQAAGGRLGPVRLLREGSYITQYTPNATRMARSEVLVVSGDPTLSATTLVQVQPARAPLSLAARVGLFTNFGSMAGPMATVEGLQALPGRAAAWAAGIVVSYLHNDLTTSTSGSIGLSNNHVEIDQVPCLAVAQYRLPVPLGANISVGGGAGISLARIGVHWSGAAQLDPTVANVRAVAAQLHTDAAFPLAPGELVMGARYLWIDLGRTSQGDEIDGNSVGFVGDIGFRMAW